MIGGLSGGTMRDARKRPIPNKLYFRIGEVSDIVGVKPYVLRYWETEFSDVRPTKSKSGQRLYKRRDVEMLLQVKELLYEERYTIDGAKQKLRETMREHRHEMEAAAASVHAAVHHAEEFADPEDAAPVAPAVTPSREAVRASAAAIAANSGGSGNPQATKAAATPVATSATPTRSAAASPTTNKILLKLKSDLQEVLKDIQSM